MSGQDFIDFLILTAWTYGNGYVVAWLVMMLGLNPHRTGSLFAVIGIVLGLWGIRIRQRTGRFPPGLAYLIWPLPFLCTFMAVTWWVVDKLQRWLGVI